MSALILDGNKAAEALLESLKPLIKKLKPKLVIVQVGKEVASVSYVKKKIETCKNVGLDAEHLELPFETPIDKLFQTIEELNRDKETTGFIVQLPLPPHFSASTPLIFSAIDPRKDVDGFTAYNLGKMFLSREFETLPPATPAGIIALLEYYKISIAGKNAVIVGRSNIVGKPLAMMLLNRDATVTVCHSKTSDIRHQTSDADILISAVGIPKFVTKDMIKKGAVVIDVGMNRTSDGKLVGDVYFEEVKEIASAITPVPGGVGPMTVASLIRNVVRAKEKQQKS